MSAVPTMDEPSAPSSTFDKVASDARAIARLAIPLAGTQLAQVAVSSISVALLAAMGPAELAGGGLAMTLFNLARTFGVGLVTGVANLVGEADARADAHDVRRLAAAGLAVATVWGLGASALLFAIGPLLALLGQEASVVSAAVRFLGAAAPGLVPCLWFNVMRNVSVGMRKPGPVLVITLVSLAVHASLAGALTKALGFTGIAISQTVTHAVTFVLLAWHVRKSTGIGITSLRTPHRVDVRRTLALGLPTALAYGSEAGFFAVIALLVGRFGATALAAHNVVNQIVYIVFMLAVGLSHGTSVVVSRARTSEGNAVVRRIGHTGLAIGAVVVVVMGAFQVLAPNAALFLFSRGATARAPEVTALATQMLAIAVGFQLFDCFQNVGGALLRALHEPRITLMMTLIGYWGVGLPAAWYFGAHHGPLGVWWGLAAGLCVTALLIVGAFERSVSRPHRHSGQS